VSLRTFITKRVSRRPITDERLLQTLNKELVPVLADLVAALNSRVYTTTFGDGVSTSYTFAHGLATRHLLLSVQDTASGLVVAPSLIIFDTDDVVTVVMPGAPAVDEMTLVVMK
jgi:hypothetical protein